MHKTEIRIQWYDVDRENIVYFGNYFRYFTVAEDDFLRARGISHNLLKEKYNVGFARVEANCKFKQPATYNDLISVEVDAKVEKERFLSYVFHVVRKDDGMLLAEGNVRTVCVKLGKKFEVTKIPYEVQRNLLRKELIETEAIK